MVLVEERGRTPKAIAEHFVEEYAAGNIEAALRDFSPNVVYSLYISEEVLPLGGETAGKDKLRAALVKVRTDFDYLVYRGHEFIEGETGVRFRVEFMYRHRSSGEVLNGRFRLVMQVIAGLVTRVDEYHDRAMVEAFLRLYGP